MARDEQQQALGRGQLDLFGGESALSNAADPEKMRALLHDLLAEARAADTIPWSPVDSGLYRTLFPQLTFWLPEEEGAQLRFEFETELARLDAAA
jgi:hypothetical protein